ncbi:glycoside hydrolase family 16 protein [Jaapia argillacea MUCL 33604]|uniref:Glycoside hydrolase family 16 protein n=1 Tax=Jaapia argillacea MUCL 33604 TaxID=933084 RepID=A0A067PZM2_9AGAM|nr:glycoside hydrolase family 16 protein [Jaapia argillacea MUCL 33604]
MLLLVFLSSLFSNAASYSLVRSYSGQTFFDDWDFYGYWDNLTLGDVWWLNRSDAMTQGLAYINDAGRAVIKVVNSSNVPFNQKRNTVRITTQDSYGVGSLWILDAVHLPYGCSVWPSFWTKGILWPNDGEIDIIEAVNIMPANQMALHTLTGCTHPNTTNEVGAYLEADCSSSAGCTVGETKANSFNAGFAAAGGGVWATQFDVSGIFIWFWSRANVPASISQATNTSAITDLSQWGPPSASYPASTCNITEFFGPQQLVLDITLCGIWAGIGPVYNATCGSSGPTGLCYQDNVVGAGSPKYDNAYFEINYVRAYATGAAVPTPPAAAADNAPSATTTVNGSGGLKGSGSQRLDAGRSWSLGIFCAVQVLAGMILGGYMLW